MHYTQANSHHVFRVRVLFERQEETNWCRNMLDPHHLSFSFARFFFFHSNSAVRNDSSLLNTTSNNKKTLLLLLLPL